MTVMRPDDRLGVRPLGLEQMLERLEHIRVTQVSTLRAAIIHDPVIEVGRGDEPRVLRRVKKIVRVRFCIIKALGEKRLALLDHSLLAFRVPARERHPAIG